MTIDLETGQHEINLKYVYYNQAIIIVLLIFIKAKMHLLGEVFFLVSMVAVAAWSNMRCQNITVLGRHVFNQTSSSNHLEQQEQPCEPVHFCFDKKKSRGNWTQFFYGKRDTTRTFLFNTHNTLLLTLLAQFKTNRWPLRKKFVPEALRHSPLQKFRSLEGGNRV